jgi:protein-tyrosine phosphatase
MVSDPAYRILIVCTGNICRSPFAERLFTSRLREVLGPDAASHFEVSSAGTWGLVGEPMQPEAARALVARGGDPAGFVSRELTVDLVTEADLVLGATREHRAAAVTLDPRASSRTLTLRELARLLGPVGRAAITANEPAERMAQLLTAAIANRGLVPPADPREDDIADPYGQSTSAYERAAEEIDAALRPVIDLLRTGAESP